MASRRVSAKGRQRRADRNEPAATECSSPLRKTQPKSGQREISLKRTHHLLLIGVFVSLVVVGTCTSIFTFRNDDSTFDMEAPFIPTPSDTNMRIYTHAAVSSDASTNCSDIGVEILKKNGSAVDAAIATVLCDGIVNFQSCGIGGGVLMTIYIKNEKNATTINGKETAPEMATENMFQGGTIPSQTGPLSIAVPGELRGLWEAHKRFGKLPWKTLFQPAIKLCLEGYPISYDTARALEGSAEHYGNKKLSELWDFLWNRETNDWYKRGEIMKNPLLAKTLQTIADHGPEVFYTGQLARDIIADIQDAGGILTLNDLKNYKARVDPAISTVTSDGLRAFTTPMPSSGPVFLYMLNILQGHWEQVTAVFFLSSEGYNMSKANIKDTNTTVETYHKMMETIKFGYAARSLMADDMFFQNMTEFAKNITEMEYAKLTRQKITGTTHDSKYYGPNHLLDEKGGTAHISVLAPNGDAVSITTSISVWFGSKIRGKRTGIIFNSQMDDFAIPNGTNKFLIPPSPVNLIKPGKRPMSSMCPSVLTNDKDGEVQMVIGSSGGSQITTAITQVCADTLWFGRNLKDSIDSPRLHHQLIPNEILVEPRYPKEIYLGLAKRGHTIHPVDLIFSRVQAIQRKGDLIHAYADYRKFGYVAGW